jgi:hypothetical protein
MKSIKNIIKEKITEYLNENSNNYEILMQIANELADRMYCNEHGSCVHFAEEFVLKVNEVNPDLLNDFYVVEGYVDWEQDEKPQEHTWISLKNGEKIDPTFQQFTDYGKADYRKRIRKKYSALEYYNDTLKGSWFSERRKEFPSYIFKNLDE